MKSHKLALSRKILKEYPGKRVVYSSIASTFSFLYPRVAEAVYPEAPGWSLTV